MIYCGRKHKRTSSRGTTAAHHHSNLLSPRVPASKYNPDLPSDPQTRKASFTRLFAINLQGMVDEDYFGNKSRRAPPLLHPFPQSWSWRAWLIDNVLVQLDILEKAKQGDHNHEDRPKEETGNAESYMPLAIRRRRCFDTPNQQCPAVVLMYDIV